MGIDFLKNILISPDVSNFETYLLDLFILLIAYNLIAYFATLLLLQTPIYRSKREFIDVDLRKKLCWSVGYAFSKFCITGNIVYIWLKGYYNNSVDMLPHWSTLIILFSIWGVIQLTLKRVLSATRKVIPA